jgi:hypothetical protein
MAATTNETIKCLADTGGKGYTYFSGSEIIDQGMIRTLTESGVFESLFEAVSPFIYPSGSCHLGDGIYHLLKWVRLVRPGTRLPSYHDPHLEQYMICITWRQIITGDVQTDSSFHFSLYHTVLRLAHKGVMVI